MNDSLPFWNFYDFQHILEKPRRKSYCNNIKKVYENMRIINFLDEGKPGKLCNNFLIKVNRQILQFF